MSEQPNPSEMWQEITTTLDRIEVPGGWLYRTVLWDDDGTQPTVAMVFVPRAPLEYRSR